MAKRFLIINPYGIGDVLFTVPMIKSILQNVPDAYIGFVANRRTAALVQAIPGVQEVVIYERDQFKAVQKESLPAFLKLLRETVQRIRSARYDVAIDLSMNSSASFFAWFAGIRERVGLNYRERGLFLTKKIPFFGYEGRHVAEYFSEILKTIDLKPYPHSLQIQISQPDLDWASDFLSQAQAASRYLIAMVPGGGESWGADASFKRWPAEKYAKLLVRLVEHFKASIVLLGSPKEEYLCKEIQTLVKYPIFSACGQTTLGQSMAILKKCNLAVVNDGGPLHMAVAAGTKTVSIFGPVDPVIYGPYPSEGHRIVTAQLACRPCYRKFRRAACEHVSCLKNIEVEDVFKEVKNILTD